MWDSRVKLCSVIPALLQGSKVTAGFHYCSWVICILCCRLTNKDKNNSVVVDELVFQSNDQTSFPEWGEYNLLFDVNTVNLPLKTMAERQKD